MKSDKQIRIYGDILLNCRRVICIIIRNVQQYTWQDTST
jgi:hypothetical protein